MRAKSAATLIDPAKRRLFSPLLEQQTKLDEGLKNADRKATKPSTSTGQKKKKKKTWGPAASDLLCMCVYVCVCCHFATATAKKMCLFFTKYTITIALQLKEYKSFYMIPMKSQTPSPLHYNLTVLPMEIKKLHLLHDPRVQNRRAVLPSGGGGWCVVVVLHHPVVCEVQVHHLLEGHSLLFQEVQNDPGIEFGLGGVYCDGSSGQLLYHSWETKKGNGGWDNDVTTCTCMYLSQPGSSWFFPPHFPWFYRNNNCWNANWYIAKLLGLIEPQKTKRQMDQPDFQHCFWGVVSFFLRHCYHGPSSCMALTWSWHPVATLA